MRWQMERGGSARREQGAMMAQVSLSQGGSVGAVGASERRGMPLVGPRGVDYRPCEGDSVLLLPCDGAELCLGSPGNGEDLEPGELRLRAEGGAEIHLRNNGDVAINGLVITKQGQIRLPGEG